jgi:hypothetical protein
MDEMMPEMKTCLVCKNDMLVECKWCPNCMSIGGLFSQGPNRHQRRAMGTKKYAHAMLRAARRQAREPVAT